MLVTHIEYSRRMDETDLAECLAALGHITRLRAVRELIAEPGGLPAGNLAKRLSVRQNSLSPHLASLSQCGLVSGTRTGREIIYTALKANLGSLLRQLNDSLANPPETNSQS
jgi:ArsR family transcriptional regulator, arsenate/arsenite/antimonite-responsive transcriptional repressor